VNVSTQSPPADEGAPDLESALRGASLPPPAPSPAGASPKRPPGERTYSLFEATRLLAVFALSVVLFDSQGLVTWAQRIEVGPGQQAALAVLRPINDALEAVGLTVPRRALLEADEVMTGALGTGEDPLLANGWADPTTAPAKRPALEEAPADLELLDLVLAPSEDDKAAAPAPEPQVPAAAMPANGAVTVLLVGDSMIAGSLGTELNKQLQKNDKLRVVSAFQTATGLSRPDVYDWMKVIGPLLERERPGLVIASFGANDATNILEGEQTLEFGTKAWKRAYARRVVAMMRALAGEQTRVLWLGLPPMRDERFAKKAAALNQLFSRTARRTPRVEFLELEAVLGQGGGEYATFVRGADGRISRFRLDDGVHYSPAGARAVARWGVDWAKERLDEMKR
jgi:uncharacterized protein